MGPVHPVIPGLEQHQVTYAKDQPEYIPLPVIRSTDRKMLTSRWSFTPEERRQIAAGADIMCSVMTFGEQLQPMILRVVPDEALTDTEGWKQVLVDLEPVYEPGTTEAAINNQQKAEGKEDTNAETGRRDSE